MALLSAGAPTIRVLPSPLRGTPPPNLLSVGAGARRMTCWGSHCASEGAGRDRSAAAARSASLARVGVGRGWDMGAPLGGWCAKGADPLHKSVMERAGRPRSFDMDGGRVRHEWPLPECPFSPLPTRTE